MKKVWKKISLALMLIFTLMTFAPYTVAADASPLASTPSLTQDEDGNYTVSSVDDLNKLRGDIDNGIDYSGKKVVLTQDIDISKSNVPLKSLTSHNKNFDGTFDGKFHTISGYTDAASGLFGIVWKDGIVENVKVDANVDIKDTSKIILDDNDDVFYGVIANECCGTITHCCSTGTIEVDAGRFSTLAGIVGNSGCFDDNWNLINGYTDNCCSNVTFDTKSLFSRNIAGICVEPGSEIKNCYFYGKFLENEKKVSREPIYASGKIKTATCAYDSDVLGFSSTSFMGNPVGYTTAQMKDKDSYTKLGFEFNKTWKIDPYVNDGYPYLNSDSSTKIATKVVVDVQTTAPNRIFVPGTEPFKTTDDCLKTTATFKVVPESDKDADLISKYNVTAAYSGDVFFNAPTIGNVPLTIDSSKLKINYDQNEDYQFVLGKVLPSTAKLLDNGAVAPTQDEEKQQIEDAKEVENIIYSKVGVGQEKTVPVFQWEGDKADAPGKAGTIVLNDDDWNVFSSARSGYTGIRSGYYDDWFKGIQGELQRMKDAKIGDQDVKMTEWEKLVLAITSIGYDPRDIKAYDLIDIISNKNYLHSAGLMFSEAYADYALTSYNYIDHVLNDGNHIDRNYMEESTHDGAKNVYNGKGADGSHISANSSADMWTMALQPIAAYYNANAKEGDKYYDVKQAMDYALDQFSNSQTYTGSFWGGHTSDGDFDLNNPWTNAQVYMTLGMAHANVFDKKFVKDGNTIFSAILEGFDAKNKTTQYDNLTYDPVQICRGIDSLVRDYEGRNSIFDCTDVKNSTVPVNNEIAALDVDKLISADKDKVDAVEKLYDALSDAQKLSMKQETVDKLTAAEKKVSPSQTVNVTGVSLDKTSASLTEGDSLQLTAAVAPDNATNTKVDWSSSDKTVASVDENGKVTAVKAGTATITAVSEDNKDAKAQCTVTVTGNNTPKPIQITNLTKDSSFKLGDDAKVSVKAENNSGKDQDESLIVALYDEGGKFINYVCGKQTIKNGDSSILTGIMKLPEEGIYKLKAFVWDSLESMNPLSDIIDIPVQSNK
ncbi:Ig-like domain-containing protein [Clostridium sp. 001]|uniref:Ig-like domain-containing protein n=1 Tax=Clostridium sp. 001 TaxID=1970093 RepID=UPI001C2C2806|nr:Ig-like domain-containing protein [Clostridium sp. 001]QXE17570.1 cell surface protein [Clostridium sp. 001]